MELSLEDSAKRAAGYAAVDRFVRDDTCIGLGTGTTAYWAVQRVGEVVARGRKVRAVATSVATEQQCGDLGIPLIALGDEPLDVAIDGADEAAPDRSLIKGGGGALFREKAVAIAARTFVAIVTERKLVPQLGAFPLPVEVVPFSARYVAREIEAFGAAVRVRSHGAAAFVSDNGNVILDCAFHAIPEPDGLDARLRGLHGVVATGLFVGIASHVLVGNADGSITGF
ncbi:MAG: ribose-5-phosphate isomerase RpiA [Candidatus Eremiobacteraeota bacterium]|nr:ribose-5-phosphate isomerase RpiA [Candidatus Eremiobacteraeota bacterium]MBC5802878.1 ribose-5-phosphate isomerase RpiA [Candidatus Eremiobacteraeota bacterium]MBC5821921.1 ribose-5-phosphate isomerase RpiA [Candidatus Eremiobacteraeota bacterium]